MNYSVSDRGDPVETFVCELDQKRYRKPLKIQDLYIIANWTPPNDIVDYPLFHLLAQGKELTYSGDPFEERFRSLMEEWREAVRYSSSGTEITGHIAYQSIIGMGHRVVPLIIRELRQTLDHWFWALLVLTEHDPVAPEDVGDLEKMREAWLQWADSQEFAVDQNGG